MQLQHVMAIIVGSRIPETEMAAPRGVRTLSQAAPSMRAVVAGLDLKPLVVAIPQPTPGHGSQLLKVMCAGVNRADLLQLQGKYPPPKGASPVLGLEVSGVLTDGRPACALLPAGAFAEHALVPDYALMTLSDARSRELGPVGLAAIPEAFITAHHILFELGKFGPGQSVLVHAGASGVGTALIQLAKQVPGTVVVASAGTPEKLAMCRQLGADAIVNYREDPRAVTEQVLEATGGEGVDLVLDCVGADAFRQNVKAIRVDGRWVLYGLLSGAKSPNLNLAGLLTKRVSLLSTTLRGRSPDFKAGMISEFVGRHAEDFEEGRLRPVVSKVFDGLEAAGDALEYMRENKNVGKVIIRVVPGEF